MCNAKHLLLVAFVALFASVIAVDEIEEEHEDKEKRLISTFQIVRFPNDACTASTTRNGTCYTSAECSDKGGTSSGSCADGFGVCCQFVIQTCGSSSSENITYWAAPSSIPSGVCQLTICPISDDIGQLRIDFTSFVITGPSTMTQSETGNQFGGFISSHPDAANTGATDGASWATNCLADRFSVSSVSTSYRQPEICGQNTGLHMYVEADPNCNELRFDLTAGIATAITDAEAAGLTTIASRAWDMTVYQYERGFINQAPTGCSQWQWGVTTGGWLTSYNYYSASTSKHLADQHQTMCVRRERGYCYACYYTNAANAAFSFSGIAGVTNVRMGPGIPCGHSCESGTGAGVATESCAYDCVIIPGLFAVAPATTGVVLAAATPAIVRTNTILLSHHPVGPQISSGGTFGHGYATHNVGTTTNILAAANLLGIAVPSTLCTQHEPYTLIFKSDQLEGIGTVGDHLAINGNANTNIGINLNYDLISCT